MMFVVKSLKRSTLCDPGRSVCLLLMASCNKEIADKLGISERTVKMHIANMIQKTGFRSRFELAVKAKTGGPVVPE